MDAQVGAWFDNRKIADALIGQNEFYIHAPAFDFHDRIFIIRQLMRWADGEPDRVAQAVDGFLAAVQGLLDAGEADDAIDLLLSFSLVSAAEADLFSIDPREVVRQLDEAERQYQDAGLLDERRREAIGELRHALTGEQK